MPLCRACGDMHLEATTVCPRTEGPVEIGPCGTTIDRYEVKKLLGGGGMGAVYRARHTMLGQDVALKLLHPELASRGDVLERFLREARAAAAAGSDRIIRMVDCSVTREGVAFIAMELLEGESLQDLLDREHVVAPYRAVDITRQVLEGLAAAHAAGVVHRDMKPGNVFLRPGPDGSDRVTILDFGISKMSDGPGLTSLTRTGMVIGTPVYMAPEQILSAKDIDHRADLYATAVMLYEMLSGRLPYETDGPAEVLVLAVTAEPTPLRVYAPELPAELISIVEKGMTREPAQRFASAQDFAAALSHLHLRHSLVTRAQVEVAGTMAMPQTQAPPAYTSMHTPATPTSSPQPFAPGPPFAPQPLSGPIPPYATAQPGPQSRALPWILAAAALGFVALVSIFAYVASSRDDDDGPSQRNVAPPAQPAQPTPGGPSMVPIGAPTTNNAPLQLRDTTPARPGPPLPVQPNGTTLTPMGEPTPGEGQGE
ncbi:MAG: serine/threonine-protein kinase [Polyangiales bacterium]